MAAQAAQPVRVLLIEDNPVDAHLIQALLAAVPDAPFASTWVERLAAGLERLDAGDIDAVLLDLTLPDSQGLDTLVRTVAHAPAVPVVILTGLQEEVLGLEAVRHGAQDYLVKGQINGPLLRRALRYAVERSRAEGLLRQKQAHLRLLTGQLPAVLWTTDCQLRFTSSLGGGLPGMGLRPDEVVGQTLGEFFQTRDADTPVVAAHRRALEGESVSFHTEWKGRSYQAQVEPLRNGKDRIAGAIGVALDVTDYKRLEGDLRVLRQIQQRLLPKAAPPLAPFDVGGASYPAEATGGDFFDYIPMPDGPVGIVIGDVSGHGFGPALLAAFTHSCLRTLARTQTEIPAILTAANRLLVENTEDERFVTLLFARLDPVGRTLAYASAGHPPGFLLDPAGEVRACLESTDTVLGLSPEHAFATVATYALRPGELVLFFTDGVPEASAPDGAFFGLKRTLEVVRGHRHEGAREIADALCRASRDFFQGRRQHDDITAVVIKAGP